jgi:hypothetical protein
MWGLLRLECVGVDLGWGVWVVVPGDLAETVFSPWDRSLNTGVFGCDMKRRTVLQQAGAVAGALGVAGCLSDGAGSPGGGEETTEPPESGDDSGDDESTTEGDDEQEVVAVMSSSIETRDASCGSGESASVSFESGAVSVSGSIPASDPCHEAVLADVSVTDGAMSVNVATAETDSDTCQQCLAVVEYDVSVSFETDGPDAVTVKHDSQGETTVVTEESR